MTELRGYVYYLSTNNNLVYLPRLINWIEMTEEVMNNSERNFFSSGQYCETREEYFVALNKWLRDAQVWQNTVSYFTHSLSSHPELLPNSINYPTNAGSTGHNTSIPPQRPTFPWLTQPTQQTNTNQPESSGLRYRIPPLWKRMIAELVDWVILFIVKLAFTFVLIDFFNLVDLEKYDMNMLRTIPEMHYDLAVELMSQLLIVELVHRFVVCIAEAYLLQEGLGGRIGGATIGKAVLGLRVVLCYKVAPIPGQAQNVVLVSPGTNLGLGWAFARTICKSVVVVVFPTCIVPFLFGFNRTAYDVLCHSIVVEDPDEQTLRHNRPNRQR